LPGKREDGTGSLRPVCRVPLLSHEIYVNCSPGKGGDLRGGPFPASRSGERREMVWQMKRFIYAAAHPYACSVDP